MSRTRTIYNSDYRDHHIFVQDTPYQIPARSSITVPAEIGEFLLKRAKADNVPFTDVEPAGHKNEDVTPELRALLALRAQGALVPVSLFDEVNLLRLDKSILLKMNECIGANPLVTDDTPKKAIVESILHEQKFQSRSGVTASTPGQEPGSSVRIGTPQPVSAAAAASSPDVKPGVTEIPAAAAHESEVVS